MPLTGVSCSPQTAFFDNMIIVPVAVLIHPLPQSEYGLGNGDASLEGIVRLMTAAKVADKTAPVAAIGQAEWRGAPAGSTCADVAPRECPPLMDAETDVAAVCGTAEPKGRSALT